MLTVFCKKKEVNLPAKIYFYAKEEMLSEHIFTFANARSVNSNVQMIILSSYFDVLQFIVTMIVQNETI